MLRAPRRALGLTIVAFVLVIAPLHGANDKQEKGAVRFRITIPERYRQVLADAGTDDFVVGIRPQDVEVFRESSPEANTINANLYTTEPQGDSTILDLTIGGQLVKAVVNANVGLDGVERFVIRFPGDRIHLFNRKTGETVG